MKLLIIAPHCHTLIKEYLKFQSQYAEEINVLVNHNYLAEISHFIPIKGYMDNIRRYTKSKLIDNQNVPKNVNVHLISTYYLIPNSKNKHLGDILAKSYENYINKNNIKFDMIHAHFLWPCGYTGVKLKEKYNVPLVITAHGYDIYDLPFRSQVWYNKIKYVLDSANYISTVSNSNLDYIKKLNVKTPVKVIRNGFDPNMFYPRDMIECKKMLGLPGNKKILLSVGNLVEIKGYDYLIDAIAKIVENRKDILCVIVGEGQLKTKIVKHINNLNLERYILLVGEKPHEDIPIWMNACDLFVLPSLRESFGIVQVEAFACGKPVVATRNGGSEEIIISDEQGLLCNPGDSSGLADTLLIALNKNWERQAIIEYSYRYKWENIVKNIINIYDTVMV